MSDEIFVINVDGYIGDSTKREIEYAKRQGKMVNYWEKQGSQCLALFAAGIHLESSMISKPAFALFMNADDFHQYGFSAVDFRYHSCRASHDFFPFCGRSGGAKEYDVHQVCGFLRHRSAD